MDKPYNWTDFYNALCKLGPDLLQGISEDLREATTIISTTSDMFWSESLEEILAEGARAGSLRDGVLQAVDAWLENVIDALNVSFGMDFDMNQVTINTDSPIIDQLVEAASQD